MPADVADGTHTVYDALGNTTYYDYDGAHKGDGSHCLGLKHTIRARTEPSLRPSEKATINDSPL
jgi:hypothetical protein